MLLAGYLSPLHSPIRQLIEITPHFRVLLLADLSARVAAVEKIRGSADGFHPALPPFTPIDEAA